MNIQALHDWLSQQQKLLSAAVERDVCAHVQSLRAAGRCFYGYALLPGEPYDISSIVAVTSSEDAIIVPGTDPQHSYYRYGVHEWADWHYDGFERVNGVLSELNAQFSAMHSNPNNDCQMDEVEIAYSEGLLEGVLMGLETAKNSGLFDNEVSFLALWISDSDHPIMAESVRRLNSTEVISALMKEFA